MKQDKFDYEKKGDFQWKIKQILKLSKHEILTFFFFLMITYYYYSKGLELSEEAYYYTLSTIAQTLAALVAFSGMFLIFRLQIINEKKEKKYKELEYLALKAKEGAYPRYVDETPHYNILFDLYDLPDDLRIKTLLKFFKELDEIDNRFIPLEIKSLIEEFGETVNNICTIQFSSYANKLGIQNPAFYSIITIMFSFYLLSFGNLSQSFFLFGITLGLSIIACFQIYKFFNQLLY